MNGQQRQKNAGLYRPSFEHDNCGIGAIVNIKGRKSHDTVANALKIVEQLEHRTGKAAEGKTCDGVGILLQISHKYFSKVCKPFGIFLGSERDYGVGMFFFPQDELKRNQAKNIFEVIVEKESYAREGVHKGMQGWICYEQEVDGYWLVNFPQYGEKNDIAEIDIKEEDLKYLPNGMNVKRNEQIKAQFDALEKGKKAEDISDYMI